MTSHSSEGIARARGSIGTDSISYRPAHGGHPSSACLNSTSNSVGSITDEVKEIVTAVAIKEFDLDLAKRTSLRKMTSDDITQLVKIYDSNPKFKEDFDSSVSEFSHFLHEFENDSGHLGLAIVDHEDSPERIIGFVGFLKLGTDIPEICYILDSDYWGKGVMTKATKLAVKTLFDSYPDKSAISGRCFQRNVGSHKVLEKTGFQYQRVRPLTKPDLEINLNALLEEFLLTREAFSSCGSCCSRYLLDLLKK